MILYPLFTATLGLLLHSQLVHSEAPSNDECANPIVIPSDTTVLPFVSPAVDFKSATANVNDPSGNCNPFNFTGYLSLWYQWVPNTNGIYRFTTNNDALFTGIELFRGNDCGSLTAIACDTGFPPVFDSRLLASETYYIKLIADPADVIDREIQETLLFVNATKAPPVNVVCPNATEVQLGDTITGSFDFTTLDVPAFDLACAGTFLEGVPTLWYKVTNTDPSPKTILASTCNDITTIDTLITVFQGSDACTALDSYCVGGNDIPRYKEDCNNEAEFRFIAAPSTTYYIAVQLFGTFGNFSLSLNIEPDYFALIDATSDQIIGAVGDEVDYSQVPASSINIEAVFDDSSDIQSVMVFFDNKDPRCERKPPFAVFKDRNGNFFDNAFEIGEHIVVAEAHTQPDCQGDVESSLSQRFSVLPCQYNFKVYQVSQGTLILETSFFDSFIPSLPCNDVNIEVDLTCGFDIKEVKFTLRKLGLLSGGVVQSRKEKFAPYYLFGNKGDVINSGTINGGSYAMELLVNGIEFVTQFLDVGDDCS